MHGHVLGNPFLCQGLILRPSVSFRSILAIAPTFSVDLVMQAMQGLSALRRFLFHVAPMIAQSIAALHGR